LRNEFLQHGGIMVIAPQPVNGLAPEILFFLKKLDAKEFPRRILGGQPKGITVRRTPPIRPKFEARISKLETNSNEQNQSFETWNISEFRELFRISRFGFRTLMAAVD
jgi:hypothetical protein